MQVMVVGRGLPEIRIGPHPKTVEGITGEAPFIKLTPWDLDQKGNQLGGIKLDEPTWKRLTEGKELYTQFTTFNKALGWFQTQGGYRFGCPFTYKTFATLREYQEHIKALKEAVNSGGE